MRAIADATQAPADPASEPSTASSTTYQVALERFAAELDNTRRLLAEEADARRSLERRAEAGDATAMTRLGALLLNLSPPDTEGALRWLKRAVEIGRPGRVQP